MDHKSEKNTKLYYKNLAKRQKKRWRRRKMEREADKEKRQTEDVEEMNVEGQRNKHEMTANNIEPKDNVLESEEEGDNRREEENNAFVVPEEEENEKIEKKGNPPVMPYSYKFKEINVSSLVKIGKSIGAGTFGHCNLARYRGMVVVVKEYRENNFLNKEQLKQEVLHEAHVISQLGDHPNLPLLYGVCTTSFPLKTVLQFHGIGENSLTILKAAKTQLLTNGQWFNVAKGIAAGLNHIHTKGYLHNDLKANNVVIERSEDHHNAVIIDFGKSTKISARFKKKNLSKEEQLLYSSRYPHVAPEIVDGSSGPTVKSDVFSYGKLLQYVVKHTSFEVGGRINSMACSAALLRNPKMRPTLMQIVNYV